MFAEISFDFLAQYLNVLKALETVHHGDRIDDFVDVIFYLISR